MPLLFDDNASERKGNKVREKSGDKKFKATIHNHNCVVMEVEFQKPQSF